MVLAVDRCVLAFQTAGMVVECYVGEVPELTCCDSFGNAGGDWAGTCIEGQEGINGNFSADPLFCDAQGGDFGLEPGSPCLPGHGPHGDCGLIGAFDQGCGTTATAERTWGAVKVHFGDALAPR